MATLSELQINIPPICPPCPNCGKEMRWVSVTPTTKNVIYRYRCAATNTYWNSRLRVTDFLFREISEWQWRSPRIITTSCSLDAACI
jgi:hypothetical protein